MHVTSAAAQIQAVERRKDTVIGTGSLAQAWADGFGQRAIGQRSRRATRRGDGASALVSAPVVVGGGRLFKGDRD